MDTTITLVVLGLILAGIIVAGLVHARSTKRKTGSNINYNLEWMEKAVSMLLALLRGMDISHWSGLVDWVVVRSKNVIQFAIAKATEGLDFLDSQWENNITDCLLHKIPIGGYHFYRHNGDPIGQAKWFHKKVGRRVKVAVADIETYLAEMLGVKRGQDESVWQKAIATATRKASAESASEKSLAVLEAITAAKNSLADDVVEFCQWLEDQGYRVVIYSSPGFIKSFLQDERLGRWELWIAHIKVTEPTIPPPWAQWGKWGINPKVVMWQDTWELVVEGVPEKAVDGDIFSPAAGDLYEFFGNGAPYEEPGDPSDPKLPDYVMVMIPWLRVRKGPGTSYTIIDLIPCGLCLMPFETESYPNGDVWYRVGVGQWVAGILDGQTLCKAVNE